MSLTTAQHDILVKYLKDVGIKLQEPFEEFYDHIATAFEKSDAHDLQKYIREVADPAFGGVSGIQTMLKEGSKSLTKHYRRVLRQKMAFYFKGSYMLIPISLYFLLYILFNTTVPKYAFSAVLCIASATPVLYAIIIGYRFQRSCKKSGANFKSSLKHQELHRLSIIGMLTLNLHNLLFLDTNISELNAGLIKWLPLVISGLVIYIIWAISCFQMVKEELTPKLIIQ